jgi:hypothetical protein
MSKKRRRQLRRKKQQDEELMEDRMRHLEAEMRLELVEDSEEDRVPSRFHQQHKNCSHSLRNLANNGQNKRDVAASKTSSYASGCGAKCDKKGRFGDDDWKKSEVFLIFVFCSQKLPFFVKGLN